MNRTISNWGEVDHKEILSLTDDFLRLKHKVTIGMVNFYSVQESYQHALKMMYPNKWVLLYNGVYVTKVPTRSYFHEFYLARLNNLHPLVKEFYVFRTIE